MSGRLLSRTITGKGAIFVVSTEPAQPIGGLPKIRDDSGNWQVVVSRLKDGRCVAFNGQVPVKVVGPVETNDDLVPSGRNDGTACRRGENKQGCVFGKAMETKRGSFVWALVSGTASHFSHTLKHKKHWSVCV